MIFDRRRFLSTLAASGGFAAAAGTSLLWALQSKEADPSRAGAATGDWPMIGFDIRNTRFNPHENTIGPGNVARLKTKWTFELAGGFIQSTPVAAENSVYFASYDGHFYCADAGTGKLKWKWDAWNLKPGEPKTDLRPPNSPREMRGSAFYQDGRIYFGAGTAKVHCLDAATGREIWGTQLDPDPAKNQAHISASPLVYQGKVFIGDSSEMGQIACLDAGTGAVRWRFYTVPGVPNAGGSVWTAPAIDAAHNIVYNVTGSVKAFPPGPLLFTESVVAHDLESGELLWFYQIRPRDPFDLDFNTHPVLFEATNPIQRGETVRHCVGAGTKAGGFHVFDRYTGRPYWNAMVTNGALGLNATAFAYDKIYLVSNSSARHRASVSVTVALHPYTGEVLWWTPNSAECRNTIAVANRLLYQGMMDGTLQALNIETGEPLWTHKLPGPRRGGISIANGTLYTSSGDVGRPPNTLFAFSVDGK